ncbi:uncharacterized protein FIBRA_03640 [Fibroporia radiculosa]|uniref:PUB domain-containing protein n=1 Tax=Fibroporia radiculosa TaxID=599839 RepID=J4GNL1_9APHY|nr:uncharacterized protein FIBRA_03640 [Fibroporia radiculosa]CCM01580.1 predicted protein [Fibroporia radiculosa]
MDPHGVQDLIIQLGFHRQAEDYQSYFVFKKRYFDDLRLGITIINEILEVEIPRREKEMRSLEEAKAADEEAKEKARKGFMDDRNSVAARAQHERATWRAEGTPKGPTKKPFGAKVKMLGDLNAADSEGLGSEGCGCGRT